MGARINSVYGLGGPLIPVMPVPTSNSQRAPINGVDVNYPQGYQWFMGQGAGAIEYVYQGAGFWATGTPGSLNSIITDSGTATEAGGAITFTGATTGLTFAGAGSTVNLAGTLNPAHGGTGAATLTGVLIGHGTSAITGNPITQHAVLIAGATNAITSLAAVAAGEALMSTGTTSDPAFTGSPVFSGSVTATLGDITATAGNLVVSTLGDGIVLNPPNTSGAASGTVTCNGRAGQIKFTSPSIAGGASQTLTMANSSITGASTQINYSMIGATTGAALCISSVTNSPGQSVIVVTNGTGATTSTADLVFTFVLFN